MLADSIQAPRYATSTMKLHYTWHHMALDYTLHMASKNEGKGPMMYGKRKFVKRKTGVALIGTTFLASFRFLQGIGVAKERQSKAAALGSQSLAR